MKRYWVEYKDHHREQHVCLYMYAYSQEQIRDVLAEYAIILIDITE